MEENDFPEIPCDPPDIAEVGDEWICPGCARKFYYIHVTLQPEAIVGEAWFTDEIR